MKKHNFYAVPAILPQSVLQQASASIINFKELDLSILEISHRSKEFESVMDESESLVRELLEIDNDYAVLFLSGGASSQFFMVPMNLLPEHDTAHYVNTGTWSSGAIKEAKLFGNVNVIASSESDQFRHIPNQFEYPDSGAYLHITSNNTIYGSQYHLWPKGSIPLVCDMSSDIFSRKVAGKNFGLIYAGAQKNMGPAGVTLVVVKKALLGKTGRKLPSMLDYKNHMDKGSMYNTPPVFPIYVSMLTMRWIKEMGGPDAMELRNNEKALTLYHEIDNNPCFEGPVRKEDRSKMNVVFKLKNADHEAEFLKFCKDANCVGIQGHSTVCGFRASLYHALPL